MTLVREGAKPFEDAGVAVFLQQARLIGERRIELEDGTQFEAERIVFATGTDTEVPSIPAWRTAPTGPIGEDLGAGRSAELPRGDRRRGDRHRVRPDLRAVRRVGHRDRGAPAILPNEDEDAAAALVPALEEEGIRCCPAARSSAPSTTDADGRSRSPMGRSFEPRSSSSRRGDGRCSAATISRPSAWSWTIADGRCSPRPCARRPRTCGWRATRPASSCTRARRDVRGGARDRRHPRCRARATTAWSRA